MSPFFKLYHVISLTLFGMFVNKKHLKFSELVTEDTPTEVLVVTFLALLELFKRAMVHLNQPNPFGDIMVDYIEGSGELVLDEQHGLTSIEE